MLALLVFASSAIMLFACESNEENNGDGKTDVETAAPEKREECEECKEEFPVSALEDKRYYGHKYTLCAECIKKYDVKEADVCLFCGDKNFDFEMKKLETKHGDIYYCDDCPKDPDADKIEDALKENGYRPMVIDSDLVLDVYEQAFDIKTVCVISAMQEDETVSAITVFLFESNNDAKEAVDGIERMIDQSEDEKMAYKVAGKMIICYLTK